METLDFNKALTDRLNDLKGQYQFLRGEQEHFVLNALVVQTLYYCGMDGEPSEQDLKQIIVDGSNDGGIDCILTDPHSDKEDLVFIQNKHVEGISKEEVVDALGKMYQAYKRLIESEYSEFRPSLPRQFSRCEEQMEDGAKTIFCFCTTAPRNRIRDDSITKSFKRIINDDKIELRILFRDDLGKAISDYKSMSRNVESGKIELDRARNVLQYSESIDGGTDIDAVIVNGSAWSIKDLYAKEGWAIFSQNLRYYFKSRIIDEEIRKTMKMERNSFWYRNNGITIVCENFEIDGKELKLEKFSIINGGQTTYLIGMNDEIKEDHTFFLPVKVIRSHGNNDDEKQEFIFNIAKASNSQKPIKQADLKSNTPEQKLFAEEMKKRNDVFYRTKRGEKIPNNYREKYKNCDLNKVAKTALAGYFLMPGTARNHPSVIYEPDAPYYDDIFKNYRENSAACVRQLLYVDYFVDTKFRKNYAERTVNEGRVRIANNSRTLCLAFCGFLSKFMNNQFSDSQIADIANSDWNDQRDIKAAKRILSDTSGMTAIFNKNAFDDKTSLDGHLDHVFGFLIKESTIVYEKNSKRNTNQTTNESNWLKKDTSFYNIIAGLIDDLVSEELKDNSRKEHYKIFVL